nr:MAG TPA: hypothetical protein [Caudoviricetes sp.]
MNHTQSPPLGLLLQVYRGLVCKHKRSRDKFTKRLRIRPSFNSPPDRLSLLPRFTVEQRQTTGCTTTQSKYRFAVLVDEQRQLSPQRRNITGTQCLTRAGSSGNHTSACVIHQVAHCIELSLCKRMVGCGVNRGYSLSHIAIQ